jgi:hypothetical protein
MLDSHASALGDASQLSTTTSLVRTPIHPLLLLPTTPQQVDKEREKKRRLLGAGDDDVSTSNNTTHVEKDI